MFLPFAEFSLFSEGRWVVSNSIQLFFECDYKKAVNRSWNLFTFNSISQFVKVADKFQTQDSWHEQTNGIRSQSDTYVVEQIEWTRSMWTITRIKRPHFIKKNSKWKPASTVRPCNFRERKTYFILQIYRKWENTISNYQGPDTLELWYQYICWYEQNIQQDQERLFETILGKCLSIYESQQHYKQDTRLVKLWMKYVSLRWTNSFVVMKGK